MDGFMAIWRRLRWTGLSCLLILVGGCTHFIKHHREEASSSPAVALPVTGMVLKPGNIAISSKGLSLREAVALAGGDNPSAWNGLSSIHMLVALDRGSVVHYFSMPLVTDDDAGKIVLRSDDKLVVQPWFQTDLSRLLKSAGKTKSGFPKFTLVDQAQVLTELRADPRAQKVDIAIVTSVLGANVTLRKEAYDWTEDKNKPNFPLLSKLDQDHQDKPDVEKGKAKFPDRSKTVIVLKRIRDGRLLEFVMPRVNSPHAVEGADISIDVLQQVPILPKDNFSVDVLVRHPLVLSSLLAPHLRTPSRQKDEAECLPKVHSGLQNANDNIHSALAPVCKTLDQIKGVVGPPLQDAGRSLKASLPR